MTTAELVAESQSVLERHGRSFRWAQVFLAPQERADAAVVYAFCRFVDDCVDEAPSRESAERALLEIEAMVQGSNPSSALVQAYLQVAERRRFGVGPALDLIAGARSDLGAVLMDSDESLRLYCYRVAGTVGLMMAGVLGASEPEAKEHAVHLGMAMQLTNICRDVAEDLARGRVYLPAPRLHEAGVDPESLRAPGAGERPQLRSAVARVVSQLIDEADGYYALGRAGFRYLPARARLAIGVAARLYEAIGHRLRDGFAADALAGRVYVPIGLKVWLTVRALLDWLGTLRLRDFVLAFRRSTALTAPSGGGAAHAGPRAP